MVGIFIINECPELAKWAVSLLSASRSGTPHSHRKQSNVEDVGGLDQLTGFRIGCRRREDYVGFGGEASVKGD